METSTQTQDLKSLIRDVITPAFEQNRMDAFWALCEPDFRWTVYGVSADPLTTIGVEANRQAMEQSQMDPDSVKLTIDDILVDGNRAVCTGTTQVSTKAGVPTFGWTVDVYTFNAGKISDLKTYILNKPDPASANPN